MPQVTIEQPGVPKMTVPLSGDEITLGRSENCDIVLVADEVSRNHARLVRRGDAYALFDLKSMNGTYVNRQRIVERILSHQDEIWFGSKCRLVYLDDTQFGREEIVKEGGGQHNHKLERDVERIREEMDRLGDSMTFLGGQTMLEDENQQAAAQAQAADVVRMSRAYRRLEALHKASQVMASAFDLRERLAKMLDLIMAVLGADRGFVILRDKEGENLNVKVARQMGKELAASSPSMGIAGRAAMDGVPVLMANRDTDLEFGMRDSIIMSAIRTAMCAPLKIETRTLGSIYVDSQHGDLAFSEEDLELFCSLASQAAMAIDNVQLHDQVVEAEKKRLNFSRFLPHAIVEKIMDDDTTLELGGQKTTATTMFCDIRGSSKLAETLSPQQLVNLLNDHFTAMTEIVFEHQGTLDKYIGDEIMAIFGAPIPTGDDAYNAICAAIALQQRAAELNQARRADNRPLIEIGIGIDTGEVIAGYIGSPMRMDYTVVGDRVNTAKRFCDMASAGKVVVGEETWRAVHDRVHGIPIGEVKLKGKQEAVHAYEILSLKQE